MPRGKPAEVFSKDGNLFNKKKTLRDGSLLLHCLKRKAGCDATAYFRPSKQISVHGTHSHLPDDSAAEATVARRELTRKAQSTLLKPREAIVLAKAGLSVAALDVIGTDEALRKCYLRARPRDGDEILADTSPFSFYGKFASTFSGDRMLLHDSGAADSKRFVIFASDAQLQILAESKEISIDATFEAAPEGFDLIWTMHARKRDKFFLAVVVFMAGNRAGLFPTADYDRVIVRLRQDPSLANWSVSRIYSDYEISPRAALKLYFPAVEFRLCYFHKNQNLRKKAASLHLLTQLIGPLLTCYRRLLVLPLLPPYLIPDAFYAIKADSPASADALLDYHERTYIGSQNSAARFSPESWSIYSTTLNGDPRCNNSKESFHLQFGAVARCDLSRGRKVRPSRAVYAVQLEEEKVRQDTAAPHNVAGVRGARKSAESEKNEKLKRVLLTPFTKYAALLDQLSSVLRK